MLKTFFKNLAWIALPAGLAVGCGGLHAPEGSAFSLMAPDQTLVATSAYSEGSHAYAVGSAESPGYVESGSYAETPAVTSTTEVTTAPSGATAESWAIGQEIQARLISDPSLAPMGSSLIAQVSPDGVVTLRGAVADQDEQQRVTDTISGLPGVKSVNSQLTIGTASTSGSLDMQQPEAQ